MSINVLGMMNVYCIGIVYGQAIAFFFIYGIDDAVGTSCEFRGGLTEFFLASISPPPILCL